ncbi:MAG: two-component sensor histidine kinase [Gammaproteobacteria bacterium]|nr:two-component sensor histidine kinase [Gammaproteobacteria bacterium]MBU2059565.1 two-component sensor histidine kinase [Gammaproteobacteria bacterium]MBU2174412.1 two-component sensor histidine kinase [Gammaproteobacteria bacterium]MBU2248037.1 two-component sensor histidine kinase [Gammaproteobacteria bacterium]MBU2345507.1 two-component sensor histidine kinase [Gammaproteobacteria bacterium]
MSRLFLHFYLFISLVLIGVGWTVERIWQETQSQIPPWVMLVADNLAGQLSTQSLPQAQLSSALPVTLLPAGSILWSEAEQAALEAGQVVPLFTREQVFFYTMQQGELWQLGPTDLSGSTVPSYWFSLLFLGLLAIAVWLWLWPVARDIQKLKQQLLDPTVTAAVPVRSFIAPIAISFEQMRQQIQRLLGLQREMTQAVSHELRTPLARLSFALELSALARDEKQLMLNDVKELEQLVDEMLDYARLESAQPQLKMQQVDLSELLQNLVEKLSPLPGAAIELHLSNSCVYVCDGHYLERAVQNLVVNAKRFARSRVLLVLEPTASGIEIGVEDDGPGIAPEQRAEILKPFVRLDPSRQKGFGGFGLGLAIVCRVLEWHKASIEVGESRLGGASFRIKLPSEPRSDGRM